MTLLDKTFVYSIMLDSETWSKDPYAWGLLTIQTESLCKAGSKYHNIRIASKQKGNAKQKWIKERQGQTQRIYPQNMAQNSQDLLENCKALHRSSSSIAFFIVVQKEMGNNWRSESIFSWSHSLATTPSSLPTTPPAKSLQHGRMAQRCMV